MSLSATVSNAEEFADWLVTVRGETRVIVEEHRPVPLWQHMMVGQRMYDLFTVRDHELQLNPELSRAHRRRGAPVTAASSARGAPRGRSRATSAPA